MINGRHPIFRAAPELLKACYYLLRVECSQHYLLVSTPREKIAISGFGRYFGILCYYQIRCIIDHLRRYLGTESRDASK